MQEEVTQKTIALSMKTGKLTAQVLQAALKKYLQHRAKSKNTLHHGQQSLKQLKKHGVALSDYRGQHWSVQVVTQDEVFDLYEIELSDEDAAVE